MILLALILAAAQTASVGTTSPGTQAAAGTTTGATKLSDRDKVVCRMSAPTGRHIVDRVCHTQYDWDRMEADGKAYAYGATHGQNGCPLAGSGGGAC